ncbi:GNAT family N-acetyltransferase [Pseudoalteromonas sp. C2R02]|uniref:GNAT family N-acetyltransferase n=1 Tax=Pseudoalteromonas sp. C2R02 TaxID=2841565 RepID=UPI001C082BAD|nr:GNAT family N-acetyltransferase [Pseudoalteromonas sp. C2R02]MBU2972163.1 GNAT family N-acetyltransferase [Pseudoalteromonas sp. C2R02]
MNQNFNTSRLVVDEIPSEVSEKMSDEFFTNIINILTPMVVKDLPPYFHNILTIADAKLWFERMISESTFFTVKDAKNTQLIGFIFVYLESDSEAHIGYLLKEDYWGKGLAKELLSEFICWCKTQTSWSKLVGGVSKDNFVSSNLLTKLGFMKSGSDDNHSVFYEYQL